MIALEVNDAVVLEQKQVLEQALSTNPKTQEVLRKLIRKALMQIRPDIISAIRSSLVSDPREASKGVRTAVYKKILGGNANILNMRRKAGTPTSYEPPRKLDANPRQRGGNRVLRGKRTNTVMHYGPLDRQWILRIVNSGTTDRMAGTRGGRLSGNRGGIAARNFFGPAATKALQKAANNLSEMIDQELIKMLNKKNS